jgi:hypothetical protein
VTATKVVKGEAELDRLATLVSGVGGSLKNPVVLNLTEG